MPAGGMGKRLGTDEEPGAYKRLIDFLPKGGCGECRLPPNAHNTDARFECRCAVRLQAERLGPGPQDP